MDLVGEGLLTVWTLTTGWMVDEIGMDDEVAVDVGIDEELLEGPVVPEGFLFSAT